MKRLIVPILVLTLGLAACSNDETKETTEKRVTPVETAEAVQGDLKIAKQFYGRTSPETMSPVTVQTPGEVEELKVKNGDQVEEGDVLAIVQSVQSPAPIEIEAPQAGEVASLNIQEGGTASSSEPLMTIVDLDTMTIGIEVTASNLSLFEDKEEALVAIENADFEEEATITHVAKIPGETGLYPVELVVGNEDHIIIPGMTAVVEVIENVVENTLLIPTAALVEEMDRTFVYVIENDQAVEVPITVIEAQSDQTAIDGELAEGDSVVIRGQLTLTDGSPVSVKREEQ